MKTTVIYAHPYDKSFCKAILDKVIEGLKAKGKDYYLIDLYKDGFDPVMKGKDLALFSRGKTVDPLVAKYQGILKDTQNVVLVFPVWWMGEPAILKGFFDKVFLKGFAYTQGPHGEMLPALDNLDKVIAFTTSGTPSGLLCGSKAGECIKAAFFDESFRTVGAKQVIWTNFGALPLQTPITREGYLEKVLEVIKAQA